MKRAGILTRKGWQVGLGVGIVGFAFFSWFRVMRLTAELRPLRESAFHSSPIGSDDSPNPRPTAAAREAKAREEAKLRAEIARAHASIVEQLAQESSAPRMVTSLNVRERKISEEAMEFLKLTPPEVRQLNGMVAELFEKNTDDLRSRLRPIKESAEEISLKPIQISKGPMGYRYANEPMVRRSTRKWLARARPDRGKASTEALRVELEALLGAPRAEEFLAAAHLSDLLGGLGASDWEFGLSVSQKGEAQVNYLSRNARTGDMSMFGSQTVEEFEEHYGVKVSELFTVDGTE
ncbi:hypothetical protein HNR46_000491 [Haloferula luteola]|uniref:Uncharacterized protein n=1 Tax=Haloferula luteola TaxID=595692 RepID=A0A840UVQ6_9BACT|nr:hypothetical protein [Haloferula luteola]MBB5350267.1 hypothetical protein [Haloferula luteola]